MIIVGIPIDRFINNLKQVRDEGLVKVCEKQIKDIFYIVLYEMARKTITDTGQSRSAIIDDFASRYGYNVSDLYSEFYGFWEKRNYPQNASRNWGNANVNYSDKFEGKKAKVSIKIKDEGLYAQENASANGTFKDPTTGEMHLYPSEVHSKFTGRDNSQFEPRHITRTSDSWVNNDEILRIYKEIGNEIRKRLFK